MKERKQRVDTRIKQEMIAVGVLPEIKAQLQRAADEDGRPLAQYVRLILTNAVKSQA